jgi:hypothetical protein
MSKATTLISKKSHGGKRKGAGRKPAPDPVFIKKFRASESERKEFMSLLSGDAREDFIMVLRSLRSSSLANKVLPRTEEHRR